MLAPDGGRDRLYFGPGGLNRDSRSEPADAISGMMTPVIFIVCGAHRLPDFRIDGKAETCRHYADDGHALAVNSRRAADDSRIAAKAPPPQTIADNRRRGRAGLVFFFKKMPALNRLHAEQRKQARVDDRAPDTLGAFIRITTRQCE